MITGTKVIDACNKRARELDGKYKSLQARIADLKRQLKDCEMENVKLREEEVQNVCDYVRTYSRLGVLDSNEIDIYLCHCQNTLHGNIDGTFLTFSKE